MPCFFCLRRHSISLQLFENNLAISFVARFRLEAGWHLYGSPLPAGYRSLSIVFDEALISSQEIAYPATRAMTFEALGETLPVFEGEFEVHGRLRLAWSPPVHGTRFIAGLRPELEALQTAPGEHSLHGTIRYQACGEGTCLMPATLRFEDTVDLSGERRSAEARIDRSGAASGHDHFRIMSLLC